MRITNPSKFFLYALGFGIILWLVLGSVIDLALGFSEGWNDNLDSYTDESLLNGQGQWITPKDVRVSNDQAYSSPNGIKRGNDNDPYFDARGVAMTTGLLSFKFYNTSTADGYGTLFLTNANGSSGGSPTFYWIESGATFNVYYGGGYPTGTLYTTGLAMNTWHTAYVEWDTGLDQARIKINELDYSVWFTLDTGPINEVGGLSIRLGYADNAYFDDFLISGVAPPEPRVWATSPASGTEITDLEQDITINWEGLQDYDTLYITFSYPQLGIATDAVSYDIVDIGGEGDMLIPLTDFNFEKNAHWYLKSIASYEGYIIEGGMFLSGYGSQFTDDLTDSIYYLDISIEGFESFFTMSDFEGWYGDNVTRFATPTAAFVAITGLLEPIYSYIGEFGSKIAVYFDKDEAYSRGYEAGRAIPVFSYYLGQVAFFIGGFPIMSIFLIILLLMVGIFIFKLVIRFIPHFGG